MLVKMEAYFDGEFWCARGIGDDIFTQGKSLDDLHENIKEAVAVHCRYPRAEPVALKTIQASLDLNPGVLAISHTR